MTATLVALALCSGVNDANWVSFGGAGAFAPHETIHMLGEDISITVGDERTHVRVYFQFENRGPATTVMMAFPFEATVQSGNDSPFPRFATKVDGQPVAVRRVAMEPITCDGREFKERDFNIARPFVFVKEVSFEEGQQRTVLVDYVAINGFGGSGWVSNEYILRSGATWAGTIGLCTITVDWSGVKKISKPSLEFRKEDGALIPVEWTFESARKARSSLQNFEPDFDLKLTSIESFWNIRLNGKQLHPGHGVAGGSGPTLSGSPNDPYIYTYGLFEFFDDGTGEDLRNIRGPVANAFGNKLGIPDIRSISDGLGRVHRLRREIVGWHEYEERVRLKDVIEALGGTFMWAPEWERIDITMPTKSS